MNIYCLVRWGNDDEGPDGANTVILVRAANFADAGDLADEYLTYVPHNTVGLSCSLAFELGPSLTSGETVVLLGPAISALTKGPTGYPGWVREPPDFDSWRFLGPCPECGQRYNSRDMPLIETYYCVQCGWGKDRLPDEGKV